MCTQDGRHSMTRTLAIYRYTLVAMGIYPFRRAIPPSPTTVQRILNVTQVAYGVVFTLLHTLATCNSIFVHSLILQYAYERNNVNYFTFELAQLVTLSSSLFKKAMFFWQARQIVTYMEAWHAYEQEYQLRTGVQVRALNSRKALVTLIMATLAIIGITLRVNITYDDDGSLLTESVIASVMYAVILLMRFYTELIWSTITIAVKNAARQLIDDYANDNWRTKTRIKRREREGSEAEGEEANNDEWCVGGEEGENNREVDTIRMRRREARRKSGQGSDDNEEERMERECRGNDDGIGGEALEGKSEEGRGFGERRKELSEIVEREDEEEEEEEEEGERGIETLRRREKDEEEGKEHYEYLWTKLCKLQTDLGELMSSIYGMQLAVNFLQVLFQGFGWHGYVIRRVFIEQQIPEDYSWIIQYYTQVLTFMLYIAVAASTADSAQKALNEETKVKLLRILCHSKPDSVENRQTRKFLQKVTKAQTHIILGGYGKIDRSFFCTVLNTWANYFTILLQFRILIQDDRQSIETELSNSFTTIEAMTMFNESSSSSSSSLMSMTSAVG